MNIAMSIDGDPFRRANSACRMKLSDGRDRSLIHVKLAEVTATAARRRADERCMDVERSGTVFSSGTCLIWVNGSLLVGR